MVPDCSVHEVAHRVTDVDVDNGENEPKQNPFPEFLAFFHRNFHRKPPT